MSHSRQVTQRELIRYYTKLLKRPYDYTFFDPSDSIYADAFGFSVYSYALAQNAASPMILELFKNSTEEIVTTLYASLADSQLFQQGNSPRTAQGALSTSVTRLFVVSPVAWVILGILFLILVYSAFLFIYAARNYSILQEESIGLLGNAALLEESDVSRFVSTFRQQHPNVYSMGDFVGENYTVVSSKCYLDDHSGMIPVKGLAENASNQRST